MASSLLATSAWLISRAAQRPSVVALGAAVIGVRFFAVSRGLCRYGERLVGHDAALRLLADLRVRIYERLETLAPERPARLRARRPVARVVEDVDALGILLLPGHPAVRRGPLVSIPTVGVDLVSPPVSGGFAPRRHPGSTAAAFVPWYTRYLTRRWERRLYAARGEVTTHVIDLIDGAAADLMAFGATGAQVARVKAADAELLPGWPRRGPGPPVSGSELYHLAHRPGRVRGLLVGVPAVHTGRLHGPLLAVVALIPLAAFDVVTPLPVAAQNLERVRQSAARLFAVMDAEPAVDEPDPPASLPPPPYSLRATGLRARYGPAEPWALDGIDLDLQAGTRVAIVGPSGAGKSTLAAVLLRFLPYEGRLTINGVDLATLAGEDVRRLVGLAAQDTHIFDTTLQENLLVARRDASEPDLRLALERSRLLDWVDELPAGLDTELGERGARLSGGQRQRVGIARTALAGFPVLILDEPGEHLDTATADALMADILDAHGGLMGAPPDRRRCSSPTGWPAWRPWTRSWCSAAGGWSSGAGTPTWGGRWPLWPVMAAGT